MNNYDDTLDEHLLKNRSGIFIAETNPEFRKTFHDRLRRRADKLGLRARTLVTAYLGTEGVIFWAERK